MLKQYHNYDSLDHLEQMNMLYAHIGKLAYEQIRVQSYIKGYEELIDRHYDSIDFLQEFTGFDDFERKSQFMQTFQFYTIYNDDCINFKKYKKVLPDGSDYPIAIGNILNSGQQVNAYGHMKFHMLGSRFD